MSNVDPPASKPNELLRYEREQHDWTREDVAEKLSVLAGKGIDELISNKTIYRWERGEGQKPSLTYRKALKQLFGKREIRQLGFTEGDNQDGDSTIPFWQVKTPLSPFFTGREEILNELHTRLIAMKSQNKLMPPALVGLGGVGKTQIAIEYARRHMTDYQTVILLHANLYDDLSTEFASIASLVGLPEAKYEQDQRKLIAVVMKWLTHPRITRWLLIFDGADNPELVRDFIPERYRGHIIITSQSQATDEYAWPIEVNAMDATEGAYLLLKRAKVIEPGGHLENVPMRDFQDARCISDLLGGLTLALDQAGAYIEETGCSLSEYPEQFQTHTQVLLQRRGDHAKTHDVPVATTWSLAFEKIRAANPAAIELLYLFAYLAPHDIPEKIVLESTAVLGSVLQPHVGDIVAFNLALSELRRYSLIRRDNVAKTCSLHSLVQTVVKDSLSTEAQSQWAERAVQAISCIYQTLEDSAWTEYEQYLPHVLLCAEHIRRWNIVLPDVAELLSKVGYYLTQRGQYNKAEQLLTQGLAIQEQTTGKHHSETATSLSNLADLYDELGKYNEAELLLRRALGIFTKTLGPDHQETVHIINNLALVYESQGKYTKAEPLFKRALKLRKKTLGEDHDEVARSLNNLAVHFNNRGLYNKAIPLLNQARMIWEYTLGEDHIEVAHCLNNLGFAYNKQGEYDRAEPLVRRALEIREKILSPTHPAVARSLSELASTYIGQDRPEQAETLLMAGFGSL